MNIKDEIGDVADITADNIADKTADELCNLYVETYNDLCQCRDDIAFYGTVNDNEHYEELQPQLHSLKNRQQIIANELKRRDCMDMLTKHIDEVNEQLYGRGKTA